MTAAALATATARGQSGARENLVGDGDFTTMRVHAGWLTKPGVWMTEQQAATVGVTAGVTPSAGAKMLQFLATSETSSELGLSDTSIVHQVIDVRAYAEAIDHGHATARAGVLINRLADVAGVESPYDRRFELSVRGFSVPPVTRSLWFIDGSPVATSPLASEFLLADGDISTWQRLSVAVFLPPTTRYLVLSIASIEDVSNDSEFPELHGHFADRAFLQVVVAPEPGGAGAACGLAGGYLLRRRVAARSRP
ncbi:MAG: hypothetical protein ACK4PI_09740 [Tepidisphaerales bacterium]